MNTAQHSTTNEIYSANQFEKMDSVKRNTLRKFLQCEECKEKAFFRNKSKNGRTACFFAEHILGCGLGNSKKSDGELMDKKTTNKKESDSDMFGIRWTDLFKLIVDETTNDLVDAFDNRGPSHTEYIIDPSNKNVSKLTLAKILHYAKNKILSKQDIKISLFDRIEKIQNIVKHAHYLKKWNSGKTGLYWGYLNSSDNICWLNIDTHPPYNRFSIQLHKDINDIFWTRMGKITSWKHAVPFILFGKLQLSESGKPYIIVQDTTNIYIDKRAYNKNKDRIII